MLNLLNFTPEERGFEPVDDDSGVLFDAGVQTNAAGESGRVTYEIRESGDKFYPQRLKRDDSGKIIDQKTLGRGYRSRERATTAIERRVNDRTTPGFGGFEIGEFEVDQQSAIKSAEEVHFSRSREARIADRAKRAPVTTNRRRYVRNPGELDFPGIDTPTQEPKVLPMDFKRGGRPDTTDVEKTRDGGGQDRTGFNAFPEAAAGSSLRESFEIEMAGRDVPMSPDEIINDTGRVSGGQIGQFREGEEIGPRVPFGESKSPGDALFEEMASQDNRGEGFSDTKENQKIVDVFEESKTDSGLFNFANRARSEQRRFSGMLDAEGAALKVVSEDDGMELL